MLRMGIPLPAVIQKMQSEGVDAERIEEFRAAASGSKVSDGGGALREWVCKVWP